MGIVCGATKWMISCFAVGAMLFASSADAADIIRINGSGSGLDMMRPILKAYGKIRPDVRIVMEKPLGSSGATKALIAGMLDIVVSSKPLKPEETAKGARLLEYAKTPLLFISHKGVGKTDVTVRELVDIYAGKKSDWDNGMKLRLILRPEGDVDTTILRALSPEFSAAITSAQKREGMTVAVTDPECNDIVAKTPGAIGASGLTSLLVGKLPLKPLTLNGIDGTVQNLVSGAYPLAKNINFVVAGPLSPAAHDFLDFVYSAKGRGIARKSGAWVVAPENVVR